MSKDSNAIRWNCPGIMQPLLDSLLAQQPPVDRVVVDLSLYIVGLMRVLWPDPQHRELAMDALFEMMRTADRKASAEHDRRTIN